MKPVEAVENELELNLFSLLPLNLPLSEHVAVSCYHRQRYQECLDVSLEILAPEGTDNREILDLALRSCLKLKDRETGERLARGCRSKVSRLLFLVLAALETDFGSYALQWITTMYLAHTCGQVLLMAGLYSGLFLSLSLPSL